MRLHGALFFFLGRVSVKHVPEPRRGLKSLLNGDVLRWTLCTDLKVTSVGCLGTHHDAYIS